MYRQVIGSAAVLLCAPVAFAHPGHGRIGEGATLGHYLTEPSHLLGAAALAAAALVVVAVLRRRRVRSSAAIQP